MFLEDKLYFSDGNSDEKYSSVRHGKERAKELMFIRRDCVRMRRKEGIIFSNELLRSAIKNL